MAIPAAIFCGNRPDHTERLLASLYRCQDIDQLSIHVFCDGAHDADDQPLVEETQKRVMDSHLPVLTCHFAKEQQGASHQLIAGVKQLLQDHDRVIVLEDGMELAPQGITFLLQSLERFADSAQLMQVSAWSYPLAPDSPCYSLRLAETWAWGTWKRAWDRFDDDAARLLERIEACGRLDDFDLGGAYSFSSLLDDHARGAISSWAICWYASMFLNNGLCLYPGQTLARRGDPMDPFASELATGPIALPDSLPAESAETRADIASFYRG
ncbi:MAG: hypothetical protein ACI8W8_002378, partial [Rhodothermales bacterium]